VLEAAKEHWADVPGASLQVDRGVHPDLTMLRPEDGREIGVDTVREALAAVLSYPMAAPVRYVVIDGADSLTSEAANAMLKTLEEPPATVRFFLLAEDASRVLPTIRSRCSLVSYGRISESLMVERLSQFETDAARARLYARLADGSLGRAIQFWGSGRISVRDQVWKMLQFGMGKDITAAFSLVDKVSEDMPTALRFLYQLLRDLAVCQHTDDVVNIDLLAALRSARAPLSSEKLDVCLQQHRKLLCGYRAPSAFTVKTFLATSFV
jgi:DNA polymerase-3 subunit delta'